MPRKNQRTRFLRVSGGRCFNEAAARCRGKTRKEAKTAATAAAASMRPRPDAAEKLGEVEPIAE